MNILLILINFLTKKKYNILLIKQPNTFKYLQYCSSKEEVKVKFKELALKLHPDKGGNLADMQQLNVEYQYITKVNPMLPISVPAKTYRQTYTTPKQQARPEPVYTQPSVLDWEDFKFTIDTLLEQIKTDKKNEASLYFTYIDFVIANGLKTNRKQLEYIAIKLGYKSGWAYYKEQELAKQKLI